MKSLGSEFEALCRRCVEEDRVDTYNEPFEMYEDEDNEDAVYRITPKGALYLALMDYSLTDDELVEIWEAFTSTLVKAGYYICDKTGESDDV